MAGAREAILVTEIILNSDHLTPNNNFQFSYKVIKFRTKLKITQMKLKFNSHLNILMFWNEITFSANNIKIKT